MTSKTAKTLLLAGVLVAAWLGLTWKVQYLLPSEDGAKSGSKPPAMGTAAPDFALMDMQGRRVALSDLRGRVVVLNFWATWCGPCRAEIPHFNRFYKERGEEVVMLGLTQEAPEKVAAFMGKSEVAYTVLLDEGGAVSAAYGVSAIPTTYIIDAHGTVRARRTGAIRDLEKQFRGHWPWEGGR